MASKNNFHGSVLISYDEHILYQKSFGYQDPKKKKKHLKNNSIYQLASVSKQFTAAAIMKLVEEGKINLSDSIQKFYPAFPITSIWLENHSSRQPWRELARERAFSQNIPSPHQPREFQNPSENTGVLQGFEVGRACLCQGNGVPYGIRTRAANVKGWCPRPLDERDKAGRRAQ